jgi:hypothetical protein
VNRILRPVGVALTLLLLARPDPAQAGDAEDAPPTPAGEVAAYKDPCGGESGDEKALDLLREGVFKGVCSSARWFDGLFGDPRDQIESYGQTYGRVGVGLAWDELDDVSFDGHFRANIQLPVLGSRFNAVIGRESEEAYINDNFGDTGFLPGSFSDGRDSSWYAGLNFRAMNGTRSRFDVSAGVQGGTPLNPYVRARYRYFMHPADRWLITARLTPFWENQDGFGITLAVDNDWSIRDELLLRWANTITRSESTDGAFWRTRFILYQALSTRSAVRYEAGLRGETGGVQPDLRELKVTYRRSVWRDWFFLEVYSGVFWADDEDPERQCDACAMAGLGFELMFGDRYDQSGGIRQAAQP